MTQARLRSDKQTGMVDDFEDFSKGKSWCSKKTLVKQKLTLHSLYFPQNTLLLTESRGEFSDLYSIFRLRALRYLEPDTDDETKKFRFGIYHI